MLRKVRLGQLGLLLAVVGILIAVAGWLLKQEILQQPLRLPAEGAVLIVNPGQRLGGVLRLAEQRGWLHGSRWLGYLAAREGLDARMQAGEYRLTPGITAHRLLTMLASGEVVLHRVTLPEGITLAEALRVLCKTEALSCTLDGPSDPRLLALVAPATSAEGWFLPETYTFRRGDSDFDVLTHAHELMRQTLYGLWEERDSDLPFDDPYQALNLASIVERETGVPSERPLIAGVFVRRLRQGMRLQTDPTVIYGLGENYVGNLTRSHLRDERNPYNTYRIPGLPPTPIALPGEGALSAVLHPAEGSALYFVAKGDGSHAFASTLEQHQQNVQQFQIRRRSDYRSSPK